MSELQDSCIHLLDVLGLQYRHSAWGKVIRFVRCPDPRQPLTTASVRFIMYPHAFATNTGCDGDQLRVAKRLSLSLKIAFLLVAA